MSRDNDFGDDLLIRARREMLLDGEERRLHEALAASIETQLLFEAGCAFDREAPVLPGDDARIENMLRAVQRRERRSRPLVRRRPLWQAVAVGMLIGAAAVAAGKGAKSLLWPIRRAPASAEYATVGAADKRVRDESATVARGAPFSNAGAASADSSGASRDGVVAPNRVDRAPVAAATLAERMSTSPSAPGVAVTQAERVSVAPGTPGVVVAQTERVSGGPGAANPGESDALVVSARGASDRPSARFDDMPQNRTLDAHAATATELFAAANRARMRADSVHAIAAYRRLQSEFPQSGEALSSRLSLGMLYLHGGQPGLAHEQFVAYRTLGRGPTLGEALWGESLALHQLGQRKEERDVLRDLLERFPESAYAAAARKRLTEP